MGFDHWIMHRAACKQVGKYMAYQLANAQLTLRCPTLRFGVMCTGH